MSAAPPVPVVIAMLLFVALALIVLTVWYWRFTDPRRRRERSASRRASRSGDRGSDHGRPDGGITRSPMSPDQPSGPGRSATDSGRRVLEPNESPPPTFVGKVKLGSDTVEVGPPDLLPRPPVSPSSPGSAPGSEPGSAQSASPPSSPLDVALGTGQLDASTWLLAVSALDEETAPLFGVAERPPMPPPSALSPEMTEPPNELPAVPPLPPAVPPLPPASLAVSPSPVDEEPAASPTSSDADALHPDGFAGFSAQEWSAVIGSVLARAVDEQEHSTSEPIDLEAEAQEEGSAEAPEAGSVEAQAR